jgi:hypothetical protein
MIERIHFVRKDFCLVFFNAIEQKNTANEYDRYDNPNDLSRDFYGNTLAPVGLRKFKIWLAGPFHLKPIARKNAITGQNMTMPDINMPKAKNQLSIQSSLGAAKNSVVNVTAINRR